MQKQTGIEAHYPGEKIQTIRFATSMYVHDAFRYSGIVNIASKGFVLDAC
jgi:hypothetical protein